MASRSGSEGCSPVAATISETRRYPSGRPWGPSPLSVAAGLAGDLAGILHVPGIVRSAHAETPLAAHVAGVLARRDGEDLDLHVRVVHLGRDDHRLRTRGVAVLLQDVAPSHA